MRFPTLYSSYFCFIYYTFGENSVFSLKKWIQYNKDLVKIKARNKYLLRCRRSKLVPKHLNKFQNCKLKFHNDYIYDRAESAFHRFSLKLLNLEISDNFQKIKTLTKSIYRVTRNIEKNLPAYICNEFFNTQISSLSKLRLKENNRTMNKFIQINYNNTYVHSHKTQTIKTILLLLDKY